MGQAPPLTGPRDGKVLRSVTNALALLEAFGSDRPELGVTELSARFGLGKSTVHRLLVSLAARGYVRKNPETERYRLGLKCIAAPVRDHTHHAVASLGIACPAVRLPEERVVPLAELVRQAAAGVSAALGFRERRA